EHLAVAGADGGEVPGVHQALIVAYLTVVDDPAAVGRVRVVIDVVVGAALRGIAAVADEHARVAGHRQKAQVVADAPGLFVALEPPTAIDPGEAKGMRPAPLRHQGDPPQDFQVHLAAIAAHETENTAHDL